MPDDQTTRRAIDGRGVAKVGKRLLHREFTTAARTDARTRKVGYRGECLDTRSHLLSMARKLVQLLFERRQVLVRYLRHFVIIDDLPLCIQLLSQVFKIVPLSLED